MIEYELQTRFGKYLISKGHTPLSHTFKFSNLQGGLKPDFWVPDLELVIEAKASSARDYVRLAIGQVLDYANLAKPLRVPQCLLQYCCQVIQRMT